MILEKELGGYSRQIIRVNGSFQTNASAAPTILRDGKTQMIKSVTRNSAGNFTVLLASGFPLPSKLVDIQAHLHSVAAPTVKARAYYVGSSYSQSARSFQVQVITVEPIPAWQTGIAVSSNTTGALAAPGAVTSVHATTGTTPGPKQIISTGTPATGQCTVTYAAGVPTVVFAAGDSISVCAVTQIKQQATDPDTGDRVTFEFMGSVSSAGTDPA